MECDNNGINWAVGLSYEAADKSELKTEQKRNLIFSVYCFRSLFDNAHVITLNPLLEKYGCSFTVPLKDYPYKDDCAKEIETARAAKAGTPLSRGGVFLKSDNADRIKFDIGSDLFFHFLNKGVIDKRFAKPPEKYSLYECVLLLSSLKNATAELKAAWYLVFPYIISIGAPHEPALYHKIRERLFTEEVFDEALNSRFSLNCADSVQELWALDMPNLIVDWMLPFIEYKCQKDEDGVSKEVKRFQKWLQKGQFADVFEGTEKLLDTFPDDEDLLLVNLAARISLDKEIAKEEREVLLAETVSLIDDLLTEPKFKRIFFLYYRGLALLGLKRIDEAEEMFKDCLEINPKFSQALVMLKMMEKYSG